ncbi:MAG: hypothetical protein DRQ51_07820 [Gammaproteobacteria bacterium]|nr:MAG: hypothetical protein DRQ51_07820 [Gammaproteobacteria bacterium]
MEEKAIKFMSLITCPYCGHNESCLMPENYCMYFYDCKNCGKLLKAKAGDCCVFCSYGDVVCPPKQQNIKCC